MSAMVFREEPLAEVRPTDPCVDLTPMALPFWTCCLSSSATSLLPPEIWYVYPSGLTCCAFFGSLYV